MSEIYIICTTEGSSYNDFIEGFVAVWEGCGDNNARDMLNAANNNNVLKSFTYYKNNWPIIQDSSIQSIVWYFQSTYISSIAFHANNNITVFGR